ncbi:MAG: DUF1549 domain-containing protein, partial [Limisphaerales bacterium]
DESDRDVTRSVLWTAEPSGVVDVDATGRVTPVGDGIATIQARLPDGPTATYPVRVVDSDIPAPIHFANQIVPVFTKNGCNGGGCHGKAAGQNGFRLSLLGFEPNEDYEHLVREARGRRLFPAAPERSLLVTKGTAELPHGGGRRLEPGSDDYQLLVRWISLGMPPGAADAPVVERVEVFPEERMLSLNAEQQLVVTAHYSDGSTEDVTRSALYEPNDKDMAGVSPNGRVQAFNQPGEVAVMVRYQAKVATFRGTIPLGAPVDSLPPSRGFVDDLVFRQLQRVGMPPSPLADDPTFLRRVTLDIAGRLPTTDEIASFLRDAAGGDSDSSQAQGPTPARQAAREAVIDRLLESTDYAEYFAQKWSALLRNKRTDAKHQRGTYAFHAWIRDSFAANKPYDRFVREILTASGDIAENPPVAWYRQVKSMQGQLEDASQLFLGQRLQCAQCHHHPYEKWSQTDYWSFGAAFSQVGFKPGSQLGEERVIHRRGVAKTTNKKNGQAVHAAGLAQPAFALSPDDDAREFLADWMTDPDNPWFAKAVANRYWKHFFGRGLVDPEDDMRETNPATNPALLEALATHLTGNGFDLKQLIRAITRSTTYQLSAEPNEHNARDRHHFSRFYPRRLPAEVLLDSVAAVTGSDLKFDGLPAGTRAVCLPDNSFNAANYFLTVFGRPESSSACECERSMDASLSQSLHLLNSKDIQGRISSDSGRAAALSRDKERDEATRIAELYRVAVGRDPKASEIQTARQHLGRVVAAVTDGKDAAETEAARDKARREGWEDVVWALLNTKEFLFNH